MAFCRGKDRLDIIYTTATPVTEYSMHRLHSPDRQFITLGIVYILQGM
jgi:hypothetical protein